MALISVNFVYLTGLRRPVVRNVRLSGSWDGQGRWSDQWTTVPMEPFTADDGCPAYRATVQLDDSQMGWWFRWGVILDAPGRTNIWGIPTGINDPYSTERFRNFRLDQAGQVVRYYLTHCRRLGANKLWPEGQAEPAIRFSVWAPNARSVELVMGEPVGGYIWSDGRGVTASYPMRQVEDGVWQTELAEGSPLNRLTDFDHRPYMFRVTKDDGSVAYRTDLYSRCQIGSGRKDPEHPDPGEPIWNGTRQELDGAKSCSVVIDPEQVTELFRQVDANGQPVFPETRWLSEEEFWRDEFDPLRPVPTRIEDLVIYELHVGGLGFNRPGEPGNLQDAIGLLDYLVDLGINTIELMPMSEFEGWAGWGYGTSHYMAVEYAGGGRDQMKHFIRECHRRGIAVLLDVVYNHYDHDAERAEWAYDSNLSENNIYYWYEGRASDYPNANPPGYGGYIDNMSTGYAPRFWDETVRKMFISSAAALIAEFHFDGFRVDQTTSLHAYAVVHADGRSAVNARLFGIKFLREWTRTLRLIKPNVILIAEDHSGWSAVTQSPDADGLGFDAVWYAEYYHHLIGDATNDPSRARLLKVAGYGGNQPLSMSYFAGALAASADERVIYHESHDEAGNSAYQEDGRTVPSARTIMVAVNWAPLIGETRRWAEARVRFTCGVTLLAPGTPMFFMGEEIGAARQYRFDDFLYNRENLLGERTGNGQTLFGYYQAIIRLRREYDSLRSHNIDILHVHDANRVLAFRRWQGSEEMLVVTSLNNTPFAAGYDIRSDRIRDGQWQEILNSDHVAYGGSGLVNAGLLASQGGTFTARIPANSVLVFQRR